MSRVPLSETGSWQLVHGRQDIRGRRVIDATGAAVGTVDEMIVNTAERRVDAVVLNDGREIPAADLRITDDAVYLDAATAAGAGGTVTTYDSGEVVERQAVGTGDYAAHADAFREHHRSTYASTGRDYADYEPAYRYGYESAYEDSYRDRTYADAEADLRSGYTSHYPDSRYEDVDQAVRHGYTSARRGRR
jgi:sporulation protein YlmC with PRC-barrel domain